MIRLVQYFNNAFASLGPAQKADELFILEVVRNVLKCSQVITRLIGRRDQQEKDVDGFAVKRGEIHAFTRKGNRADQRLRAGMPGVRNGHTLTDSRRAKFLAIEIACATLSASPSESLLQAQRL